MKPVLLSLTVSAFLLSAASVAQAQTGLKIYADNCAACHGPTLQGMPELASPQLAGPAFKKTWAKRTVGDLYTQTMTTMPSGDPGSLGERAYLEVVKYIMGKNNQPIPANAQRDQLAKIAIKP